MAQGEAPPTIKCMTVGDSESGKVKLLQSLCQFVNSDKHNYGTIFEGHPLHLKNKCGEAKLSLWDVSGQEEYSLLRCLQYSDMDLFIFCFSIAYHQSFKNIKEKWYQEVREHCPKTPVILVGTKQEKRDHSNDKELVTRGQGYQMKQLIGATRYIECSYKTNEGLDELIKEIILTTKENKNCHRCLHCPTHSIKSCAIL